MIKFIPDNHLYISDDNQKWVSVSTLVHQLQQPFDAQAQSVKSSKNKRSKWHGMTPEDIREVWDSENRRSTDLGTWYHNKMEQQLYNGQHSTGLRVHAPDIREGVKYSGEQKLAEGIYPEHLCYLPSAGICGQSDIVTIHNNTIDIDDHKSNKEIKREGYYNWETGTQRMLPPLSHLDDCNYVHYALQLSLYAHIIHRHNPQYTVGKLTIHHVQFEHADHNEYGYPVHRVDENGEPVVREIIPIEVPYMQKEVILMLNYLKNNRNKIHK